jgi:septal ring factor EnvC (AmiA/AmiB activator)
MENIISFISTIVLGVVAIIGIILNYRKEAREAKRDSSSDLQKDYERRNALLSEAEKKCASLAEKVELLEEELSRANREKIALLSELVAMKK